MPKITDAFYVNSTNNTGYIIGYQDGVFCRWPVSVLQGASGNAILVGTTAPNNGSGDNGDIYLNSTTWDIYQKSGGTWGTSLGVLKGTDGAGVPTGGTSGQVLAKNSSTNYDTHWVSSSGSTPVDLSSATSDYSLAVGETAYVNYSSATSVLLHVTTVANGMYQLIINNNKTTATTSNYSYLKPNNTNTGSNAVENLRIYYGSSSGNGIVTHTNFRLGSGITLCSDCIITTRTANKSMHGKSKGYEITNKMLYDDNQFWTDTTTAWTSLGTIAYGEAQTGRIVVYRII